MRSSAGRPAAAPRADCPVGCAQESTAGCRRRLQDAYRSTRRRNHSRTACDVAALAVPSQRTRRRRPTDRVISHCRYVVSSRPFSASPRPPRGGGAGGSSWFRAGRSLRATRQIAGRGAGRARAPAGGVLAPPEMARRSRRSKARRVRRSIEFARSMVVDRAKAALPCGGVRPERVEVVAAEAEGAPVRFARAECCVGPQPPPVRDGSLQAPPIQAHPAARSVEVRTGTRGSVEVDVRRPKPVVVALASGAGDATDGGPQTAPTSTSGPRCSHRLR